MHTQPLCIFFVYEALKMKKALAREVRLLTIAPERDPARVSARGLFTARKAGGFLLGGAT